MRLPIAKWNHFISLTNVRSGSVRRFSRWLSHSDSRGSAAVAGLANTDTLPPPSRHLTRNSIPRLTRAMRIWPRDRWRRALARCHGRGGWAFLLGGHRSFLARIYAASTRLSWSLSRITVSITKRITNIVLLIFWRTRINRWRKQFPSNPA